MSALCRPLGRRVRLSRPAPTFFWLACPALTLASSSSSSLAKNQSAMLPLLGAKSSLAGCKSVHAMASGRSVTLYATRLHCTTTAARPCTPSALRTGRTSSPSASQAAASLRLSFRARRPKSSLSDGFACERRGIARPLQGSGPTQSPLQDGGSTLPKALMASQTPLLLLLRRRCLFRSHRRPPVASRRRRFYLRGRSHRRRFSHLHRCPEAWALVAVHRRRRRRRRRHRHHHRVVLPLPPAQRPLRRRRRHPHRFPLRRFPLLPLHPPPRPLRPPRPSRPSSSLLRRACGASCARRPTSLSSRSVLTCCCCSQSETSRRVQTSMYILLTQWACVQIPRLALARSLPASASAPLLLMPLSSFSPVLSFRLPTCSSIWTV